MSGINSTNEKQKYLAVAKQKQSKKSQRDDALESKRCKNQLTVKVVAPETLPEGFKFEAELNEETFQVKVVSQISPIENNVSCLSFLFLYFKN